MSNGKVLRLPTFIHVGPPRTGTTWLHEALMGHIGLPSKKETRFFSVHYDRGVEWYCNLFGDYPPDVPAGEIAPTYFSDAVARERIKRHIPDCKIIVTFREPAARLYSLYRLIRSGNRPVSDTFDGFWRLQIDCGVDLCSYAAHLRRWQAAFGKSQVLVLLYEDLASNPQGYLDAVCDFIGARRIASGSLQGRKRKSLSGSCRRALQSEWPPHDRGSRLGVPPRRASINRTRPACGTVEDHAAAIGRGLPAAKRGIG